MNTRHVLQFKRCRSAERLVKLLDWGRFASRLLIKMVLLFLDRDYNRVPERLWLLVCVHCSLLLDVRGAHAQDAVPWLHWRLLNFAEHLLDSIDVTFLARLNLAQIGSFLALQTVVVDGASWETALDLEVLRG